MPKILSIICVMFCFTDLTSQCLLDSIVINAILIDPSGGDNEFDTNLDGIINSNDEFIELCNQSQQVVDISAWILGDDDPPPFPDYSFPDSTFIQPGACLLVVVNYCSFYNDNNLPCNLPDGVLDMEFQSSGLLGNSGDVISLIDTVGNSCSLVYGNVDCASVDVLDIPNFDPNLCDDWGSDIDGCPLLALGDSCDYLPMVLPIELLSFSATVNDKQAVEVHWVATNEFDNYLYELEWKDENGDFETLVQILPSETPTTINNYSYTHQTPSAGINFYRLKQIDYNGAYSYSSVIAQPISFDDKIRFYPTIIESNARISGDAPFYYLSIHSIDGYTISDKLLYQNNDAIDLSYLPSGQYLVRIFNGQHISNYRFIKI